MERVSKVGTSDEIDTARALVWELFDSMRERYPAMIDTIDDYIASQDVARELADFAARFLPPLGRPSSHGARRCRSAKASGSFVTPIPTHSTGPTSASST